MGRRRGEGQSEGCTFALLFPDRAANVASASGGWDDGSAFQGQPFDIVITNIRRPRCDGLELVARLRSERHA